MSLLRTYAKYYAWGGFGSRHGVKTGLPSPGAITENMIRLQRNVPTRHQLQASSL